MCDGLRPRRREPGGIAHRPRAHARGLLVGDQPASHVALGDGGVAHIKQAIGGYIAARGIAAPAPDLDEADTPCEVITQMAAIRSIDLAVADVSAVIWATVFRGNFSYLDFDIGLDEHGLPAYPGGVSPIPGLYYVGFPWLRTRASGVLPGAAQDAAAVCEQIADVEAVCA